MGEKKRLALTTATGRLFAFAPSLIECLSLVLNRIELFAVIYHVIPPCSWGLSEMLHSHRCETTMIRSLERTLPAQHRTVGAQTSSRQIVFIYSPDPKRTTFCRSVSGNEADYQLAGVKWNLKRTIKVWDLAC